MRAGRKGTEMKRVIVDHYGGPEVLKLVEEDDPRPSRGEVLVRVLAAGVSFTDAQLRAGTCAGLMSECRSACGTTGTRPTVPLPWNWDGRRSTEPIGAVPVQGRFGRS